MMTHNCISPSALTILDDVVPNSDVYHMFVKATDDQQLYRIYDSVGNGYWSNRQEMLKAARAALAQVPGGLVIMPGVGGQTTVSSRLTALMRSAMRWANCWMRHTVRSREQSRSSG